jgi:hypothetical protein
LSTTRQVLLYHCVPAFDAFFILRFLHKSHGKIIVTTCRAPYEWKT